ncbi:hypothetical protein McpSp1_17920 [Methanocorpusculaceae archaeon Sp1]|nr:hypothetical protein [Methanocorpusculaceae archaeon Sp1]
MKYFHVTTYLPQLFGRINSCSLLQRQFFFEKFPGRNSLNFFYDITQVRPRKNFNRDMFEKKVLGHPLCVGIFGYLIMNECLCVVVAALLYDHDPSKSRDINITQTSPPNNIVCCDLFGALPELSQPYTHRTHLYKMFYIMCRMLVIFTDKRVKKI